MDGITPTLPEIPGSTSEPSALQVTLGRLNRYEDHDSRIFSGFAGLLAILLIISVLCVVWNWNKRQKRRGPYLRVTITPLLPLPRPRQRAKNINDFLPGRQEELGRRQSRTVRIFSTESLLSRNSDSPPSAHLPSQAGSALRVHRARAQAAGYPAGIYDNATRPRMCGNLPPSARHVRVRAAGECLSISSEDSRDYGNVPTAEEIAETLASTNTAPRSLFVISSGRELRFTEERGKGCGDASQRASVWSPGTESSDSLSDEDGSSQASNDYVNMAALDLSAIQRNHPLVSSQCCRDYENVPRAEPSSSQQQAEVTSSNTDQAEGRTHGPGTHVPLAMQSGRFLDVGDYVTYQPSTQSDRQASHGDEVSGKGSDDYENMQAARLGGGDSQPAPDTRLLPDELRPSHPAGKTPGLACPARSKATTGLLVKTCDRPCTSADSLG